MIIKPSLTIMRPRCLLLHACIALAIVLIKPELSEADKEVCLLAPFISSLRLATIEPTGKDENYNLKLFGTMNYDAKIRVENVIIGRIDNKIDAANSKIYIESFTKDQVNFIEESPKVGTESKTFAFTKDYYVSFMKSHYKDQLAGDKSIGAIELGKLCSKAFIPRADWQYSISNDTVHWIRYYDHHICAFKASFRDSGWTVYQEAGMMKVNTSNIVSATYAEPLLFELTGSGNLYIRKFRPGQYPSEDRIFGGEYDLIFDGPFTPVPASFGKKNVKSFLSSSICTDLVTDERVLSDEALQVEYDMNKPFKTILKFSKFFYHIEASGREYEPETFAGSWNDLLRFKRIVIPSEMVAPGFITDAWWFNGGYHIGNHSQFVLINKKNMSVALRGNTDQYDSQWGVPDDLTYWVKCDKIVQVFGYLYLLHDRTQNIRQTEAKLNLFDVEQFDAPIEALLAEGQTFWFLTRAMTIQVMQAKDGICNKLVFEKSNKKHIRQAIADAFQKTYEGNYLSEGRYYDLEVEDWVPPWPKQPDNPAVPITTWVFLGVALIVILLLVAVFILIYNRNRSKPETVIYYGPVTTRSPAKPEAQAKDFPLLTLSSKKSRSGNTRPSRIPAHRARRSPDVIPTSSGWPTTTDRIAKIPQKVVDSQKSPLMNNDSRSRSKSPKKKKKKPKK